MVNTEELNGDAPATVARDLPEYVTLTRTDLQALPAPGTQRALKAETGRDYMAMVGPDADSADRTQTQVWVKLRRSHPGLRWAECENVAMIIRDDAAPVDPTGGGSYAASPPSAVSGA